MRNPFGKSVVLFFILMPCVFATRIHAKELKCAEECYKTMSSLVEGVTPDQRAVLEIEFCEDVMSSTEVTERARDWAKLRLGAYLIRTKSTPPRAYKLPEEILDTERGLTLISQVLKNPHIEDISNFRLIQLNTLIDTGRLQDASKTLRLVDQESETVGDFRGWTDSLISYLEATELDNDEIGEVLLKTGRKAEKKEKAIGVAQMATTFGFENARANTVSGALEILESLDPDLRWTKSVGRRYEKLKQEDGSLKPLRPYPIVFKHKSDEGE